MAAESLLSCAKTGSDGLRYNSLSMFFHDGVHIFFGIVCRGREVTTLYKLIFYPPP